MFFTPSNHRIPLAGAFKWFLTKAIIRLVIGRAVLFHSLVDHECYDALAAVKFFYYVSWEIDNETLDLS